MRKLSISFSFSLSFYSFHNVHHPYGKCLSFVAHHFLGFLFSISTYTIVRGVNVVINDADNVATWVAQVQDPSQRPGNVYHVHPFDGPSFIYVTPVLTHSNYHAWPRSMRRALGRKNMFDFIAGLIPISVEFDLNFKACNRCNMLVHSWILNSVEESITQSIIFLENAVDCGMSSKNASHKMITFASLNYNVKLSV